MINSGENNYEAVLKNILPQGIKYNEINYDEFKVHNAKSLSFYDYIVPLFKKLRKNHTGLKSKVFRVSKKQLFSGLNLLLDQKGFLRIKDNTINFKIVLFKILKTFPDIKVLKLKKKYNNILFVEI